eukprot:4044214-Prymnesium_polylepis.1
MVLLTERELCVVEGCEGSLCVAIAPRPTEPAGSSCRHNNVRIVSLPARNQLARARRASVGR